MDWANEPYVRLYTRETTDDVELSWDAISLWRALLCKFDRSGLMEARNGWTSVAKAVRCDLKMAEAAGAELVKDGRVRLVKGGIYAPNFVSAQTASKSDKVRQRESRDNRRARAESQHSIENADSNHGVALPVSHAVTHGHAASQNVTLCLAVAEPLPCSALPSVIGEQAPPVSQPNSPGLASLKAVTDVSAEKAKRKRGTQIPDGWSPRLEERARARDAGLDCDAEVEAFRDHHKSRGNAFLDWDAAFRTWIRNGLKFSKPKQSNQTALEAALQVARGGQ